MYYVEHNSRPVDDKTFGSIDEAIAAAKAPRWAGDVGADVAMISETKYNSGGQIFVIVSGENPTAARREAKLAASVAGASTAQVRYIVALRDQVPASAYDVIIGGKSPSSLSKSEASSVISRLKSIAVR